MPHESNTKERVMESHILFIQHISSKIDTVWKFSSSRYTGVNKQDST